RGSRWWTGGPGRRSSRPPFRAEEGSRAPFLDRCPEPGGRRVAPVATLLGDGTHSTRRPIRRARPARGSSVRPAPRSFEADGLAPLDSGGLHPRQPPRASLRELLGPPRRPPRGERPPPPGRRPRPPWSAHLREEHGLPSRPRRGARRTVTSGSSTQRWTARGSSRGTAGQDAPAPPPPSPRTTGEAPAPGPAGTISGPGG